MGIQRRIFGDAILVTGVGAVTQLVGFVATVLIAERFGASATMDAFYLALAVPGVLMGVLAGTIKIVVIPFFVEERLRRPAEAGDIVCATTSLLLTGSAIGAVVVAGLARVGLLDFGASREVAILSRVLILELLALVPLTVLFHFYNAIYNSYQRFALAEIAQSARYVVLIACLLVLGERWGVQSLVLGHVAGQALALAVLIIVMRHQLGLRLTPLWAFPEGLKRILAFSLIPFLSYSFVQLNPLVARAIAAQLPTGSIAVFSYAEKLATIPNLVFGAGFAGVLVSHWSRLSVEGSLASLRESLNRGLSVLIVVLVPVAAAMVLMRHPLIGIAFERGAFDASAAARTADVFAILAIQIVPAYLQVITVRVLLAEKATVPLLWISVLALGLNLFLMQLFVWLGLGVVGLALGALLATSGVAATTALLVDRKYAALAWGELKRETAKVLAATTIMIATLAGLAATLRVEALPDPAILLLGSGVGASIYLLVLHLLGHRELMAVRRYLRTRSQSMSLPDRRA